MAKEKVLSIEEFMELHRSAVKKKVDGATMKIQERIKKTTEAMPVDNSAIVLDKINNKGGVSYSALKKFRESPMTYVEHLKTPFVQTPAMIEGSVLDAIVTTPKQFNEKFYIITEEINGRTNEGKALKALYYEMAEGKTVITYETFEECCRMAESLWANEDAKFYLERMKTPQRFISFKHRETGLNVRGILDWDSPEEMKDCEFFIADLKKAASAKTEDFKKQGAKLDYHLQVGLYTMFFKYRWQFPAFMHIVVEPKPPYNVNVFRADAKYIQDSQEEAHNTLMAFKYCLDNNLWHKSYNFIRHEAEFNEGVKYEPMQLPRYYTPKF